MRAFSLLPVLFLGSACAMDQGFHAEQNPPPGQLDDTAVVFDAPADLPVAVCDVAPNPVTPPFEQAEWDGSASYDPTGGQIVEWDWRLVEFPAGSAVDMPLGDAIRSPFQPDMAGDYVGQLVVTNDVGMQSDPCTVTLQSIPAENLWVEMYWTEEFDDMDLHLIRNNGNLKSNDDCYYGNCVPPASLSWGSAGPEDDPSLDLDDIPGMGPENINISQPESTVFTVYVHDYSGSNWGMPGADTMGGNDVTVNIYLNGEMVWSDTRSITGENEYTAYADIDWTSGTVTGR